MKKENYFCEQGFEVSEHAGSRFASSNTNILSRIRNSLVNGLNKSETHWLPDFLAVVLDDDFIKYLDYNRRGISTLYGTWLEWLIKKVDEAMKEKLDILPEKAKSTYFIYWVLAPTHVAFGEDNIRRIRFNQCLSSIVKLYPETMRVVRLFEFWDENESNLVVNGSYTDKGFETFWKSFDATMKFNINKREVFLAREKQMSLKRKFIEAEEQMASCSKKDNMKTFFKKHKNDKFHWRKGAGEEEQHRFWLPRPPRR